MHEKSLLGENSNRLFFSILTKFDKMVWRGAKAPETCSIIGGNGYGRNNLRLCSCIHQRTVRGPADDCNVGVWRFSRPDYCGKTVNVPAFEAWTGEKAIFAVEME